MENLVRTFLHKNKINFEEVKVDGTHFPPPDSFWKDREIIRCKNLFFRDNHGKNHFLIVFDYYKTIDIKRLSQIVGRGSLTFASGWRLEKFLKLKPGFLSVFGILNDLENHVKVIIDKDLNQDKNLSFLPNTEGGSFISLGYDELVKFLVCSGNRYEIEEIS